MKSAVIIGSGNVATALAKTLQHITNIQIMGVYSQTFANATTLANTLQTQAYKHVSQIPANADLYLLAITDSAIAQLSQTLKVNGLVVHTSGATGIDELNNHHNYGVFYPLNTFTKNTTYQFLNIPILVEGNTNNNQQQLLQLAKQLSNQALEASTQQRQALHVSAVFANNFTNHLFVIAQTLLEANQLPFSLLYPLINQTAQNALLGNPQQHQTGPVVRNDQATISLHLKLLQQHPAYRQIYELISQSIATKQSNN